MRRWFLCLFFAAQVAAVLHARFSDHRYFSWAPFDQISFFTIQAEVNGRELGPEEVHERYVFLKSGRENRSIHHVFDQVKQFENTYFPTDTVKVTVSYQTNGKPIEEWSFESR